MDHAEQGGHLDLLGCGNTATRIKAAAVYLFAAHGYAATGIRDIAKAVGITNAGVYHFVTNKATLLREIMIQSQELLSSTAEASLDGVDEPEDRLALLVSGLVAAHGVNRMTSLVTDGEIRALPVGSDFRAETLALRDEYEELWRDALERGARSGVFTIASHRLTRLALLTMCTGISEWYRSDGDIRLDSISYEFVDIALASVRARRDGQPITAEDVAIFDSAQQVRLPWEPCITVAPDQDRGDEDR